MQFEEDVYRFIQAAQKHGLAMLMVGGGAVNFHGYRRHSADVDFWINPLPENFECLLKVLQDCDYEINELPLPVLKSEQNISINISPEQELELITRFNPGKSFEECYQNSRTSEITYKGQTLNYQVLGFDELISSKVKAARAKDLLDIQELKRLKNQK